MAKDNFNRTIVELKLNICAVRGIGFLILIEP